MAEEVGVSISILFIIWKQIFRYIYFIFLVSYLVSIQVDIAVYFIIFLSITMHIQNKQATFFIEALVYPSKKAKLNKVYKNIIVSIGYILLTCW